MTFRKANKRFKNGTYYNDNFWKDFANYVYGKQHSPERKLKHDRKECLSRRGVHTCKQCLHYKECYEGKAPYDKDAPITPAERRLGLAIIYGAIEDYKYSWKHGEKNSLNHIKKWLRSEIVGILSCDEYDGVALEEGAHRTCQKLYGSFEKIYERKQRLYTAKLEELEKKYKAAKDGETRKAIGCSIAAVRGKLNA